MLCNKILFSTKGYNKPFSIYHQQCLYEMSSINITLNFNKEYNDTCPLFNLLAF